jgi:hypothetical protein
VYKLINKKIELMRNSEEVSSVSISPWNYYFW